MGLLRVKIDWRRKKPFASIEDTMSIVPVLDGSYDICHTKINIVFKS